MTALPSLFPPFPAENEVNRSLDEALNDHRADPTGVPRASSRAPGADAGPADGLEDLCEGILAILGPRLDGRGTPAASDLSPLRAELAGVITSGAREMAAKLRRELSYYATALENLQRLSACQYVPLPDDLQAMRDDLERARERARHLAEALEALGERGGGQRELSDDSPPPALSTQAPREPAETGPPLHFQLGSPALASPPAERSEPPALPAPPVVQHEPRKESRTTTTTPHEPAQVPVRRHAPTAARPLARVKSRPASPAPATEEKTAEDRTTESSADATVSSPADRRAPAKDAPPGKDGRAGPGGLIRVSCPACGAQGAVRWDKLNRLQVCRGCSRSFRVDPKGGLIEVVHGNGRWVDRKVYQAGTQRARLSRLLLRRALPAAILVLGVLWAMWLSSSPVTSSETELPTELEPRVELFTRAWLSKDWARQRLLVAPGEDKVLYKWTVRHPPPARPKGESAEQDVKITVAVFQAHESKATVKVRVVRESGGKSAPVEVLQQWEKRGGAWYYVVPRS